MHASQGARQSNCLQRRAAHLEERRAFCIARLGRELSGEWAVGRTLGFADQDSGKNPARPQNFAALSRKTRVGGSDLRAARGGAGENGAELTGDGINLTFACRVQKGPDGNGVDADSVILRESRGSDSALEHARRARENERQKRCCRTSLCGVSVRSITVARRPGLGASRAREGPCLRSRR